MPDGKHFTELLSYDSVLVINPHGAVFFETGDELRKFSLSPYQLALLVRSLEQTRPEALNRALESVGAKTRF